MSTTLDHGPYLESTTRRGAARSGLPQWEVRTSSSLVSVRMSLPVTGMVTAQFSDVVGVVDVAAEGHEAVALLIDAGSLDTQPEDLRAFWLGPDVLDATYHPRLAVVLDEFHPDAEGWHASGRLHIRREIVDIDTFVQLDPFRHRCRIAFGVDRDAVVPTLAQPAASVSEDRRIDVVVGLALARRSRTLVP